MNDEKGQPCDAEIGDAHVRRHVGEDFKLALICDLSYSLNAINHDDRVGSSI